MKQLVVPTTSTSAPRWSAENLDHLAGALRELGAELAVAPGETIPVPGIDGVLLGRMEVGTLARPGSVTSSLSCWMRENAGRVAARVGSSVA